ncbi:Clan SB, family S8, subtilisin-like serine peptidase [Trichomonas vaginalis G3]|uniref:Clan SB, family S8, subtilisin-like serine peptidase n=1 Tax=Trichomonas vaginalis (strain ATCC PRA-98 / G3) TaxID=412133 RepID=A2DFX3_TRIV3|nr:proprotein convertase subtilisin/kexin-related family [Trichomonas vaginalis G3]EAY20600.1 Clan SB, family S8, subtilisin-like serine peptidase [Trichomonas vaginalis G3]KAI5487212.1 proprotein convertase subtilisin/kexin-related family [Trichomonas vaginalis G3]|eukprot:XP_001581586.1 Clan SB, family S8, subtilisin-like serine peptidase [Trichomonas vaginalis G3]
MGKVSPTLLSQLLDIENFPKSTRKLHSINPGWFYIHFLNAVNNSYLESFDSHQLYFSLANKIEYGWYKHYLNEEQSNYLQNKKDIKLYSIIKPKSQLRKVLDIAPDERYLIETIPEWAEENKNYKVEHFARSFYTVSGNIDINAVYDDPRVASIRKFPSRKLKNRFTTGYIQTNDRNVTFDNDAISYDRPLTRKGLNGKGQVISVFDTGVDYLHPFFYDPNVKPPVGTANPAHRKILQIVPCADSKDVLHGHGTHVCGTALGEAYCGPECGLSLYNGVASKSKLIMYDLGFFHDGNAMNGDFSLENSSIDIQELGSYISSNSWGVDVDCDEVTWGYDVMSYFHPHLLFVFAAGNSGAAHDLSCPSDSKSVLSVGSVDRLKLSYIHDYSAPIYAEHNSSQISVNQISNSKNILSSSINDGAKYRIYEREIAPVTDCKDKVVMISRNDCETLQKAVDGGAAAVIMSGGNSCSVSLSNVIGVYTSEDSFNVIKSWGRVTLTKRSVRSGNQVKASFSSYGPSFYSLTKPDILVPGQTVYSSDGAVHYSENPTAATESSLVTKSGTSMSTPAAAGMAAIIRQFFVDKFYPYFEQRDDGETFNPTSYFVRACFITCSQPIQGASYLTPDTASGYGTPVLNDLLGGINGLRVCDEQQILPGKSNNYKVKTNSSKIPLVITMAYLDYVPDFHVRRSLFADLDLIVRSPSGKIFKGNGKSDSLNTNERVYISENEVEEGEYDITVLANNFAVDKEFTNISYALVAMGPISQEDFVSNPVFLTKTTEKPKIECSNGVFNGDKCVCNDEYTGMLCDKKFQIIEPDKDYRVNPVLYNIYYYSVSINDNSHSYTPELSIAVLERNRPNISVVLSASKFDNLYDEGVMHTAATRTSKFSLDKEMFGENAYLALYSSKQNTPFTFRVSLKKSSSQPETSSTASKPTNIPPTPEQIVDKSPRTAAPTSKDDYQEEKVITPTIIALSSALIIIVSIIIILLLWPGVCRCVDGDDSSIAKKLLRNRKKIQDLKEKLNPNHGEISDTVDAIAV